MRAVAIAAAVAAVLCAHPPPLRIYDQLACSAVRELLWRNAGQKDGAAQGMRAQCRPQLGVRPLTFSPRCCVRAPRCQAPTWRTRSCRARAAERAA